MRHLSTERLARFSATRPWFVVPAWFIALLLFGALASRIGDVVTPSFNITTNPESKRADKLVDDRLRGPEKAQESAIVRSTTLGPRRPDPS